ncbi:thioesterase family protein [Nocardia transvalensis]|nr:thioesterase family protein [Nocardia transvalensis]
MVGPFGGITAAMMVRAIQDDPRHLAHPVSLTVNFAGPISDGPFEIETHPVRTNRSTQHWSVTLSQNDAVTTTATAVFAERRPTWTNTEIAPPAAPAPDTIAPTDIPTFVAWPGNYDMRFIEGDILDIGRGHPSTSTTTLWVRDKPTRPLDYPALAALSDIFFPRVMHRLGRLVPAGTVTLTTYFHATAPLLRAQSNHPLLATARAHHFGNGYFDQAAELWSHDGELLVTSHQLVYFKDADI